MLKLSISFLAFLFSWTVSAQDQFSVPVRSPEQQKPRIAWMVHYQTNVAISYAKTMGKTVDEFGKFSGDLYKTTWPQDGGFKLFVEGNLLNLGDLSHKIEITEQTVEKVVLMVYGFYPELRRNNEIYGVTYEEYIRFIETSHNQIAKQLGCSISLKIVDGGLEVVLMDEK